jgi:YggT family protein
VTIDERGIGVAPRAQERLVRASRVRAHSLVLRHRQVDDLVPVVVASERSHRIAIREWGLARGRLGRKHVVELELEARRRPQARLLRHAGKADGDRGGSRERAVEGLDPSLRVVDSLRIGHEDAIAPVEGRVVRCADDQVIAVILDRRSGVFEDGEIGGPAERQLPHRRDANRLWVGVAASEPKAPTMVLDTVTTAENFVDVFIGVYILVILLWVLASWIRLPYSLKPVERFLHDVCDPYLGLWRRILPSLGSLDLSPIVAILALVILREVLDALLSQFH